MKYTSNTIDNERFNIYYGVDGSVGNILQTQLTMNGSTYILGWEPFIVNYVSRIFPTDPFIPEYILNCSLSIVFEEYFIQTHPSQNIC
jgi:hypothetical protein